MHDLRKDPDQLQNLADNPVHTNILKRLRKRCNTLRDEYGGEYDPSRVANYKKEQNRKRAEAQARRKAVQQKKAATKLRPPCQQERLACCRLAGVVAVRLERIPSNLPLACSRCHFVDFIYGAWPGVFTR